MREANPALELAATLLGRADAERDLLTSPRELEGWLGNLDVESPVLALRLADFRALREAVRSVLVAAAEGRPVPPDAAERLNAASAAAPVHVELELDGAEARRVEVQPASDAARLFARIARSAIELVGGEARLRVCPAPRCGRVFVSARPGRVWCSAACGNRVRVARHHERRRNAPAPPPADASHAGEAAPGG